MKREEIIEGLKTPRNHPDFRVGDTIRTHVKIREGEKERVQVFEGTVIRKRAGGKGASFTVRKMSYGIGVERIFPLESAAVEKIEIVTRGRVRRARLYYLRQRKGKAMQVEAAREPVENGKKSSKKETTTPGVESQSAATAR